jgi:NADPH:quinone reductase
MRAVVTKDFGSGPIMSEVDNPVAGPGEIRVRVRASSLNGFDVATAHGYFQGVFEHSFPVVLGRDFAGTVDQVGDAVNGFALGDDVFGVVLTFPLGAGGFGEFLVLPADHNIAHIPPGLDYVRAGALGLAGAAAATTLDTVAPVTGETVLVSGATGGVGAITLQLLVARGCVVIATAHGDAETAHVRNFGANFVVDYTRDLAEQVRAIAPAGVDVGLHFAGDPFVVSGLVVPGGRFATLLGLPPEQFGGVVASSVVAAPFPSVLSGLAAEVAAGRLRIPVQRSYPLDDVPQAFADFAGGTIGKLVVRLD